MSVAIMFAWAWWMLKVTAAVLALLITGALFVRVIGPVVLIGLAGVGILTAVATSPLWAPVLMYIGYRADKKHKNTPEYQTLERAKLHREALAA